MCIFPSTTENEAPILYFKKIILKILPFSPTHPYLEKLFRPHLYCNNRGSQPTSFVGGKGSMGWGLNTQFKTVSLSHGYYKYYCC